MSRNFSSFLVALVFFLPLGARAEDGKRATADWSGQISGTGRETFTPKLTSGTYYTLTVTGIVTVRIVRSLKDNKEYSRGHITIRESCLWEADKFGNFLLPREHTALRIDEKPGSNFLISKNRPSLTCTFRVRGEGRKISLQYSYPAPKVIGDRLPEPGAFRVKLRKVPAPPPTYLPTAKKQSLLDVFSDVAKNSYVQFSSAVGLIYALLFWFGINNERRRIRREDERLKKWAAKLEEQKKRQEWRPPPTSPEKKSEKPKETDFQRRVRLEKAVKQVERDNLLLWTFRDPAYHEKYATKYREGLLQPKKEEEITKRHLEISKDQELWTYIEKHHPDLFCQLNGPFHALQIAQRLNVKLEPQSQELTVDTRTRLEREKEEIRKAADLEKTIIQGALDGAADIGQTIDKHPLPDEEKAALRARVPFWIGNQIEKRSKEDEDGDEPKDEILD